MNNNNSTKFVAYLRKSSEAEDRQVLSIPAQKDEIEKFAKSQNITIIKYFEESMSAKAPGRIEFNSMLNLLDKGKADGILAWHPDRLARNSMDGGRIIWLLDQGKIKNLAFPSYTFTNSPDGKMMLSIIFSQAKYYVDQLSVNVKRGNKKKREMGWISCLPPLGYLNHTTEDKRKIIIKDPNRFEYVKKAWVLLLSRKYNLRQITEIAKDEWKLTTRRNLPISKSQWHRMFNNPFFYGYVKDAPLGIGKHDAMISYEQFVIAQSILKNKHKVREFKRDFSYRSIIKCGSCGHVITIEEKKKKQKTYYHCAARAQAGIMCREPSIEIKDLEKQIVETINSFSIPKVFLLWTKEYLKDMNYNEVNDRDSERHKFDEQRILLESRINKLNELVLDEVIDKEDYKKQKAQLTLDLCSVREKIEGTDHRYDSWQNTLENAFYFFENVQNLYANGSFDTRTQILDVISSNLTLNEGKLAVDLKRPFEVLFEMKSSLEHLRTTGKPYQTMDFGDLVATCPRWRRR